MKEELKDFIADLVTDDLWSATTLPRLFAVSPGTWISVAGLCEGLRDATDSYQTLMEDAATDLMAMWLPHPGQPEQAYVLLFYLDEDMSSTVSIVTREYLQQIMLSGVTLQGCP